MSLVKFAKLVILLNVLLLVKETTGQGCDVADIGLVIDSSGSVTGDETNWNLLKSFLKEMVGRLDIGPTRVRVGAINYATRPEREFYLNRYSTKDDYRQHIDRMRSLGTSTNTGDALEKLRNEIFVERDGDRATVPNIAIVITDGQDRSTPGKMAAEARTLKEQGVKVIAVGITNELADLRIIASEPNLVIAVDNFEGLMSQMTTLLDYACTPDGNKGPACAKTADICLILDGSTSIVYETYDNWYVRMLGFAGSVVDSFPISSNLTRIGVIKFSDFASVEIELDDYDNADDLLRRVSSLTLQGGETNLADALRKARREIFVESRGDRPYAKNIAILVTDGRANLETEATQIQAQLAKDENIEIFTVGITQDVDENELREIASDPDARHHFFVNEFDQLDAILQNLIDEACNVISTTSTTTPAPTPSPTTPRPTTTTTTTRRPPTPRTTTPRPPTPSPPTPRPSTPSPTPRPTTTRRPTPSRTPSPEVTTTPYIAPPSYCVGECVDAVFVIDGSGSINERNFKTVLQFGDDLVRQLDIEGGRVRLGVMTFSDQPKLEFHLNRYNTRAQVINALKQLSYDRLSTNTAAAIRYMHQEMFGSSARGDRPDNGDRSNCKNVAIIITDGESNDKDDTLQAAMDAKKDGIHIISIGVGNWLDRYELMNIASYPYDKNMIHVSGFSALQNILLTMRDVICDNQNECRDSGNPCRNGGRCVNGVQGFACVNCPYPYTGANCGDTCRESGDVVLAIDASGSIGKANFRKVMDFVASVIQSLDIARSSSGSAGTRIGMVTFGNNVKHEFDLNTYSSVLGMLNAVNVRYTGGTTNTADAIRYIRDNMFRIEKGDRSNVPNYIVVITDGRSNDPAKTWEEAIKAREADINIVTVGVGQGVNMDELEGMSSEPVDRNVITAQDFDSLGTALKTAIYDSLCGNNRACLSNPCRNGAVCKEIVNGFECGPCPRGFSGTFCEKRCGGEIDLTFVLDSSGSIRIERFPEVKKLLINITQQLDVHPDRTRVGLVYWSNTAHTHFYLDQYNYKQDVIQAIRSTPWLGGTTNTAAALERVRTDIYRVDKGDRPDVQNIAILVTDGNSNINPEKTIPEAITDREDGIHIMAVSVGRAFVNMLEIEGMVSLPTKANTFNVERFSQLPTLLQPLADGTCDDVNECASNPCRNGGRCVNQLKRYFCDCQSGWTGYNCNRRCATQLDVVMCLDLSGSVEEEYRLIMNFATAVAQGLDMRIDRTRLAAITYSSLVNGQFYLNKYISNKEGVLNALNFYHKGGRTNTQACLSTMRSQHFTGNRGDRFGVKNVGILVTDGYSNVNDFNTVPEATRVKQDGIELYSIAIGESPNLGEMNDIASDPDNNYVHRLQEQADIDRVAGQLLDQLCR